MRQARPRPVYAAGPRVLSLPSALAAILLVIACAAGHPSAQAQAQTQAQGNNATANAATSPEATVIAAREALRKRDRTRLMQLRAQALAERNPLALWVDYWELTNRIAEIAPDEAAAFFARWPGSYVEDRFRNDWLLELGKRGNLEALAAEYPRFRMDDDREVKCWVLLADLRAGRDVPREAALAAWNASRDADDGCNQLGQGLFDTRKIDAGDVWSRLRLANEANRLRLARQTAALLGAPTAARVAEAIDQPARTLARLRASKLQRTDAELAALALVRTAAGDPDSAAELLDASWAKALPADLAAFAWAATARQSAIKLNPEASKRYAAAEKAEGRRGARGVELSDDMLAWKARAALRAGPRWPAVMEAITAMSTTEQQDPQWQYWKARAAGALAAGSSDEAVLRTLQRETLQALAGQMNYYGQLAAEELSGKPQPLPPPAAPPTPAEREAAAQHLGLQRALALIAIGLRSEGVREWNFSLRGMGDRELLAAAALACEREVWDRCINTSDRTRSEVDLAQRFPTPHRTEVVSHARDAGLDPAYVYGLIRQESRFVMDARSGVGASGLMQIMPATARWTAKKIGLDYTPQLITDRDTNLRLGNAYLKLVLDDLQGSQAMGAAAYNAGPGRPRQWRQGPTLEPQVWVENIPFGETRDYVKKVLSNAAYYAQVLDAAAAGNRPASVKSRLGRPIGPADPNAPVDKDLP